MQGADKINSELEVGFDQVFEKRWSRAERAGYLVMLVFVAAGLGGLFGRGPYSHRTARSAESGLVVDFEPIAQSQTDTQVTLHLDNPGDAPTVELFLGTKLVEPMGLHAMLPQPVTTRTVQDGLLLTLAVPAHTHDATLRVMLQPLAIGPQQLVARLGDHAALHWTQLVVP